MPNRFIEHIANDFKTHPKKVLLVENNDRFLYREDVMLELLEMGITLSTASKIEQRISYELLDKDSYLILLNQNNADYLEDIKNNAVSIEFRLENYLRGIHIPSVKELALAELVVLFEMPQLVPLDKHQTLDLIKSIEKGIALNPVKSFDFNGFEQEVKVQLEDTEKNWYSIGKVIAKAVLESINTPAFSEVQSVINEINKVFQEELKRSYHQTKNSSAVKKPKIVSKILDYLHFNFKEEKIALIVVDGLALWQYELLSRILPANRKEDVIYSWLPSITQLSRQAIFRGDVPQTDYRQGPSSEKKLWESYWKNKGNHDFEIAYQYESADLSALSAVQRLAIVFKDLDEKMHSSTDYADLFVLTENWIARSEILDVITGLLKQGFQIFLTTDHGNIQARGWRSLNGREKLGTNKSGSRSQRHIEYSEDWLSEEFLDRNPELREDLVIDEQAIYLTSDLSFSSKESLVTHGGAHILEVLIPFVEIRNEA